MEDCIFCKIAKKEISSKILYEDDQIIATMDINPKKNGHTLIIPKNHYEDYTKLTEEILNYIMKKVQTIASNICKKLNCDGYSLVINYGSLQEIKHFHLHILPNSKEPINDINKIFETLTK